MPDAKVSTFQRAARKLGFAPVRQKGSHERWNHPDGRQTTIPVHPSKVISGYVYYLILQQMGITDQEFRNLK